MTSYVGDNMVLIWGSTPRHALRSDSPQNNNRKSNSIHPHERPNVKHSIVGYLRLPQPTPAPALMQELHWHRS